MDQGRKRGRPSTGERAARRLLILDVSERLFGQHGFAGTSIEAIAAHAGVTKRTVYSYFADKVGVFTAAIDRQHVRLSENLMSSEELEEAATRIVHALHSDEAVALHRLVIAESPRLPELASAFYEHGPKRSIDFLLPRVPVRGAAPVHERAEALYTLLLGESHRRRLLGLSQAPTLNEARAHAIHAIALISGADLFLEG